MPADPLGMLPDFGALGVFLLGDVAGLLEQRHVDVGFGVAGQAGIAVPVPGAAEVGAALDDADVRGIDTLLAQIGACREPAEAAAGNDRLDLADNGLARAVARRPWVAVVALGQLALEIGVLAAARLLEPAVAL